jgi:hypothetical protein
MLLVCFSTGLAQDAKTVEGEYLIESALKSGLVLDVKESKAEDLTPIQLAGPGNQANRRWRLIPLEKGEYVVESVLKKGMVLDVMDARAATGTPLQLAGEADAHRKENRRWKLIPTGDNGEYQIESVLKEGLMLEVKDGKAEINTPIQIAEATKEPRQLWRLIRVDLGK